MGTDFKLRMFFAAFVLIVTSVTQVSLAQKTKVIKPTDYIQLNVPEHYYIMSEDDKLLTFPSIRMPLSAVTTEDKSAVMGINKSNNAWSEDDLEILMLFYKSNIQALHDEVSFIQEGIQEINGKSFIVFEFTSISKEDGNAFKEGKIIRKYNYLQYAVVKDDIIIFNFYTAQRLKQRYEEEIKSIMNSVVIKKIKNR